MGRKPLQNELTPDQRSSFRIIRDMVSQRTGYSQIAIEEIVKDFFNCISDELAAGKRSIQIRPYFIIESLEIPETKFRNPKTGEIKAHPPHNRLRMRTQAKWDNAVGNYSKYERRKRNQSEYKKRKRAELLNPDPQNESS